MAMIPKTWKGPGSTLTLYYHQERFSSAVIGIQNFGWNILQANCDIVPLAEYLIFFIFKRPS